MKKSFGIILLILILILACGLGALAYFFMNQDARLTKVEAKVANLNSTENTNTVVNEVKTEKNEVEEELLDDVELPEDEDLILYEDLEGIYEIKDENREGLKNQLILYKDGTFSYSHGTETVANFSGNYIIDGNKLLMNVWFKLDSNTASVKDCFKTNESFEMKIQSNGKYIIDGNDFEHLSAEQDEVMNVRLTKSETPVSGDINEIIYDYIKNY